MRSATYFHTNFYKKTSKVKLLWGDFFALFAGILLPLAFQPFGLYIFAFIAPAILLLVWRNVSAKRACWRGWLFGLGLFGVGTSWIYVSVHTFGQSPTILAIIITALFIMFLASYFALQGFLLNRFFPHNTISKYLLAFPASWVLLEWVRGWFLTGFPWLFLGYSQMNSQLRGLAPLISVYGVSWAVALTSGFLLVLASEKQRKNKLFWGTLLAMLWICSGILTHHSWTQRQEKPIRVSLIQGNIPQDLKWSPTQALQTIEHYKTLTQTQWNSELIIWPEAAITLWQTQAQQILDQLSATAASHRSTLITGIPITLDNHYYNGLLALGQNQGMYLKKHLVPFGEFMPLKSLLVWLKNYVQIPMSDFSRGTDEQKPIIVNNNVLVAPFICYEIAYPEQVLASFPASQLIVVLTDDSWFGKSFAPAQHMQMTQMRALETGRYLLMSTNDGITVIIGPDGNILKFAPPFQPYVLTGKIYAQSGKTPLMIWGIRPILVLLFLLLVWAWWLQKKVSIPVFAKRYSTLR
jgi:apolipoprotein N-acyltransferase